MIGDSLLDIDELPIIVKKKAIETPANCMNCYFKKSLKMSIMIFTNKL